MFVPLRLFLSQFALILLSPIGNIGRLHCVLASIYRLAQQPCCTNNLCHLHPRNARRAPKTTCFPLIDIARNVNTALGVASTSLGWHPSWLAYSKSIFSPALDPAFLGTIYVDLPIGLTTCVLSLITNPVATLLVGYKAWCVMHVK